MYTPREDLLDRLDHGRVTGQLRTDSLHGAAKLVRTTSAGLLARSRRAARTARDLVAQDLISSGEEAGEERKRTVNLRSGLGSLTGSPPHLENTSSGRSCPARRRALSMPSVPAQSFLGGERGVAESSGLVACCFENHSPHARRAATPPCPARAGTDEEDSAPRIPARIFI